MIYQPSRTSRSVRPRCPECAHELIWMPARLLVASLPPGERQNGSRLVSYVKPHDDAWSCTTCGNYGVLDR